MSWDHEPIVFWRPVNSTMSRSFILKKRVTHWIEKKIDLNEILLGMTVLMLIVHFTVDIAAHGFEVAYCFLVEDNFNQ